MSFIIGTIKVIFLLGFLVFIHEGGHFLVAKLCKVFVKEFSIGFGPKIISWQGKETKYSIRLIPLGGYVSMLGEEQRSLEEGSFSQASILKRASIVLAGPIVNIVFGIIVYFVLMSFSGNNPTTVIKGFSEEYNSASQELMVGDIILELNGKKIHTKTDLDREMSKSNGDSINIKIRRGEKELEKTVIPNVIETKSIGAYFATSSNEPKVKYVEKDSSAQKAGIQVGDVITKINNIEIENYQDIAIAINSSKEKEEIDNVFYNENQTEDRENIESNSYYESNINEDSYDNKVKVEVRRNIETLTFEIEPTINKIYVLGVYLNLAEDGFVNNIYYAFWNTIYFTGDLLNNVKTIFTGGVSVDQMTGPIGISEMVVETNGVYDFIYLMCMISLSLGITNLLPIPALDGGRLFLLIIEGIRRKPLKEEIELQIQLIGFTALIVFSLYISYKDILRIF